MTRNWKSKLIGTLSFASVLFIFQACYGTPQDLGNDIFIEGQVKSKTTGEPIKGIKVSVVDKMQSEYTNDEGKFSLYTELADNYTVKFEDVDSTLNGVYNNADTILGKINKNVYLDIALEKK